MALLSSTFWSGSYSEQLPVTSPSAASAESEAFGASRSLSLLLLLARVISGSAELGVGNFDGGGIACDLPLALRTVFGAERFSLSEENDAAGEGDNAVGLSARARDLRVVAP